MQGRNNFVHLTHLILVVTSLGVHFFSTSIPSTSSVPGTRRVLGDTALSKGSKAPDLRDPPASQRQTNKTSSTSSRSCRDGGQGSRAESGEGGVGNRAVGTISDEGCFHRPDGWTEALRQEVLEKFQGQGDGVVRGCQTGEVRGACIEQGQAGRGRRRTVILIVREATGKF